MRDTHSTSSWRDARHALPRNAPWPRWPSSAICSGRSWMRSTAARASRSGSSGRMCTEDGRPRLARGVRLRYDAVRSTSVLVRWEGAVALTPAAAAVLERCEGDRTGGAAVAELEAKHAGAALGDAVRELLGDLESVGVVVHATR